MARIIFYIVLLVISFSILLYSMIKRGFDVNLSQPGGIRLMVQLLVFIGILVAFITVLRTHQDSSGK